MSDLGLEVARGLRYRRQDIKRPPHEVPASSQSGVMRAAISLGIMPSVLTTRSARSACQVAAWLTTSRRWSPSQPNKSSPGSQTSLCRRRRAARGSRVSGSAVNATTRREGISWRKAVTPRPSRWPQSTSRSAPLVPQALPARGNVGQLRHERGRLEVGGKEAKLLEVEIAGAVVRSDRIHEHLPGDHRGADGSWTGDQDRGALHLRWIERCLTRGDRHRRWPEPESPRLATQADDDAGAEDRPRMA